MKLKREEVTKIAHLVWEDLKSKSEALASEDKIRAKLEAVLLMNLEDEVKVEEEVKKIMEQYKAQIASGAIDPQKIYMMIKKQVARDKKFIF